MQAGIGDSRERVKGEKETDALVVPRKVFFGKMRWNRTCTDGAGGGGMERRKPFNG